MVNRITQLKLRTQIRKPIIEKPAGWYRNIITGEKKYFTMYSAPAGWIYDFSGINNTVSNSFSAKISLTSQKQKTDLEMLNPKPKNLFRNNGYVPSFFSNRLVKINKAMPPRSNWHVSAKFSSGFSSGTFGYETKIMGSKIGGELKVGKLDVYKMESGWDSDKGWDLYKRVSDDTYENGISAGNVFGGAWNNEMTIKRKIISNTVEFNLWLASLSYTTNDKESIITLSIAFSASAGFVMGAFAGLNGHVSYKSLNPKRWTYDELVDYCNRTGTPPPWPFPKTHPNAGLNEFIRDFKTK